MPAIGNKFKTAAMLLCALLFAGGPPVYADPPDAPAPTAKPVRAAPQCLTCHNDAPVTLIFQTPHGVRGDPHTPFGEQGCQTCHGEMQPGARTHPTVIFKGVNASPVATRNAVCLTCHENGLRMDFAGSQHHNAGLACVSCHTIHAAKDPVLVKATQPQVCFTCHAEQRAESLQYSHHPITEGIVVCSDCHNPHGSPGPNMLKRVRVTDVCYTCHQDKRGPMLWEHQPVREDCTNCHDPHGSVNARLLKEAVPFLCLDCHSATNDMGGGGDAHAAVAPGSSSFYLFGDRSCLNCHSQIHGSNSPSGSTFFR